MKSRHLFGLTLSFFASLNSVEAVLASQKTLGIAGAGIAFPQDAQTVAYNPAGMVDVGNRFDTGITWDHTNQHARVRGNLNKTLNRGSNAAHTRDFYTPGLGINKMINDTISLGFAVYNRNFLKTTYTAPFPLLGKTKLGLEYVHETFSPCIAVKIRDRFNFGISLNYMVQRFRAQGLENFDNAHFSTAPGHVTNRTYDYSTGFGFTFGFRAQVTNCLSIGATYQPETSMRRFHKFKGFLADHGKFNIPEAWGIGFAYQPLSCMVLAFDIYTTKWKDIKGIHNPLLPNLFLNKLGSKNGSGFGWRNQTYYRFGVEYAVNSHLNLRAGFRHVNTPIRRSQTAINLLSCETNQDVLTLGATYKVSPCQEITFAYVRAFSNIVHGKNSIPPSFGGGNVDLNQDKDALGVSWGVSF